MKHSKEKALINKAFETSSVVSCPVCFKKTFRIIQKTDTIPYFGEVLETFASCDECGYKTSDILPLEKKSAPVRQKQKISSESDLNIRVVKSKFATIKIPEIKLKIEPGPGSEAFITNVEGILIRILRQIKGFQKINPKQKKEYEKIILNLEKMKQGKKKFTLVLNDKTGQSAMLTPELKNL